MGQTSSQIPPPPPPPAPIIVQSPPIQTGPNGSSISGNFGTGNISDSFGTPSISGSFGTPSISGSFGTGNISGSFGTGNTTTSGQNLTQDQIQNAMSSNFTIYSLSTGNPNMSQVAIDLSGLQQCLSNNNSGDCISQYIKGMDNTVNSYQNLVPSQSNITIDSGGNIIVAQNFDVIDKNNCNVNSINTLLLVLLIVYLFVLVLGN
jgi:hypothetical protein